MSEAGENPFPDVTDPESLSPDDRNKYSAYWFARTPEERLGEAMRLNIAKWGDEVFERGMDKSRIEVIHMKTGVTRTIYNTLKK